MLHGKEVIILTGCSGRTGTSFAPKFSDPRYAVVGLDSHAPKVSSTNFEYINCDLGNAESIHGAMNQIRKKYGDKIASFVHIAASHNPAWEKYEAITVKAAEWLIDAAHTFQTEQFLFASTLLVHTPCEPGQKITENWPIASSWEYPRSKIKAEEHLLKTHGNIPLLIMRLAGGYDDQCHQLAISHQIRRIYENQLLKSLYPGNALHGSAYVHYEDLADAIWLAVQRRFGLSKQQTLLIAEPETVSYGELQKVIGLLCHGQECRTYRIPKWLALFAAHLLKTNATNSPYMIQFADQNYSVDIGQAVDKLGWTPKRSLRQTLPKMIASLKENPLSWYRENGFETPASMKKQ